VYLTALSDGAKGEQAAAALAQAGFLHDSRALQWLPREDLFGARLPDDRIAWFPLNDTGRENLVRERRVLRLLETYCQFSAPRVLHESESGWDLRALVPGIVTPFEIFARVQSDSALAYALGEDLGRVLAEQHTRIPTVEIEGWLPVAPDWPDWEDIPYLPQVTDDACRLTRIDSALQRHASETRVVADPVLLHGDLGLHNIALDPVSHRLRGVFDYRGAAFGDRHHDFRYMIFQTAEEPMLDGALSVYEPVTGIRIDRERIRLFNAVAAIGFLAFRHGHPPEEAWCGRTLAEDLAWTEGALRLIGLG
jgi:aminoglycoside phosphotransferase (APT) family kinase protein